MRSRSSRRMLPTKSSPPRWPWRSQGRPDRADIDGGEQRVERGGELGSRSRIMNRKRRRTRRGPVTVSRLLVAQAPVGWTVIPRMCTRRGGVLDDEESVEPVHGDGVEVKEVARENRTRLGA